MRLSAPPPRLLLPALLITAAGCVPSVATSPALATPTSTGTPLPTSAPMPSPTPALRPDLSPRPLFWFGPLPPMPTVSGRPFIGSEDFLDLFDPAAPWTRAADQLHVFKLYGEWVAYHASDVELRLAVEGIRRPGPAPGVRAG